MKDPNLASWIEAIRAKLSAMEWLGVWKVVDIPAGDILPKVWQKRESVQVQGLPVCGWKLSNRRTQLCRNLCSDRLANSSLSFIVNGGDQWPWNPSNGHQECLSEQKTR
jgi:hypothetical protein